MLAQVLADTPDVAAAIVLGRNLRELACREELVGGAFTVRDARFRRFLVAECNHSSEERCHAIYLDAGGRFLNFELVARGTLARVSVNFRPLFSRSIELGASGLIIVHNHPSGSVEPSREDIAATKEIAKLASALSISLVDHLIVSGTKISSMCEAGLL